MSIKSVVIGVCLVLGGVVCYAQQTPTWSQFVATSSAATADARWRAVTLPQPRILMAGQLLNANLNALGLAAGGRGSWTGSAFTGHWSAGTCNPRAAYGAGTACTWNNSGGAQHFIGAAYAAGVRVLDVNMDPEVLSAAAEYNPQGLASASYASGGTGCTNGTQNVTFAANGGVVGTVTVAGHVPTGSVTLSHPGYGFSGATATGQVASCTGTTTFNITLDSSKVIASDCPGGATYSYGQTPPATTGNGGNNWACATLYNYDLMFAYAVNTYGIKLHLRVKPDSVTTVVQWTAGTTEQQFIDQYAPVVVAAVKRWGGLIDSETLIHEAIGGFQSNIPFNFTTTWISDYITNAAASIRTFNSTVHLGACADTPFPGDAAYMTMYLAHPSLDYVCVDLYGRGCTMATYGAQVLSVAQAWAQTALANGKTIRLEEAGSPPHMPLTCSHPDDTDAYEGSGWTGYSTSGIHDQWLETITPLMSAWGMTGMTVFCDEWMIWATSSPSNSNCVQFTPVSGAPPWLAMTATQLASSPNEAGVLYGRLGAWPAGGPASLQGNAHLTGKARIGN